ncbi:paraquat-inducible protein A [bacterium]|nr:paraquat-inducible protein A [bacterium]
MADPSLIACPHCDLLQRLPALPAGGSARCPRCDRELARARPDAATRSLALSLAAACLFVVANAVPMLGLRAAGRDASTTVIGGAIHLWTHDERMVAALVLCTAVLAPGAQIALMLAVALGARAARPAAWVGALLRHQPAARTWSMIEVMLLGVLVALIKIADYANVIPGTALFVLAGLVFVLAAMQASFDARDVWARVVWADAAAEPAADLGPELAS